MNDLNEKLEHLKQIIEKYDNLGIAFSGGVDSTFLLAFAYNLESNNFKVTALTVNASNFAPDEIEYAKEFCVKKGINHIIIDIDFSQIDGFKENSRERCYYCKRSIFSHVKKLATDYGITAIADGTNLDDDSDYRPGKKALVELGVVSPLKEALLTKNEIRQALKDMGISIWNKPAFACLASRIPYGEGITEAKLNSIYKIEKAIRDLGFSQVRVRHHGDIARIELMPEDIQAFAMPDIRDKINQIVLGAGFSFATLDLAGYKMGNMNTSPL
ncbi:MAG: ATP-dependent sacrificial sulfur transferase LarE [Peptostreptococcaceae bacterium]|nr:ATP-dependent sacrificial sulfur transferase LarE [Peptostreptococcaceae bacterium]